MDILVGGRAFIGRALRCALLGLVITFSSGQVLAQGVTDAVTPRASLGDAEKKKTSSEPGGFHTSTGDAPVSSETKSYGPVGRNENILMIAQGLPLHEQFSVYQIMRGFYLKNPEAFTNGNISLLREGVMLTIPDVSTTGDVSRPQAIEFVLGATFNIPNLMASKEVLAETTEVSPGEVLPDKEPAELGEAVVNQDIPEDKEVLVETAAASSGEPLPDEEPTELGMEVVNQDITGYMGSDFPSRDISLPDEVGDDSFNFVVPPKRERLPDDKTVRISRIVVQRLTPRDQLSDKCKTVESVEVCPVCMDVESEGFCAIRVVDQDLDQILSEALKNYDNQLTLFDLEDVAGSITKYYREGELILDTAFLPPQTITDETLVIHVLQGRLGELVVKGNKRYQADVLLAPFTELKGKPISREAVTNALLNVWDYPGLAFAERKSRLTFLPGKSTGLTDLDLEVYEEKSPYNLAFSLDNTGSEYTGVYRARVDVDFNNISGKADLLSGTLLRNFNPGHGNFFSLNYERPVISSDYRMAVGGSRNAFNLGQELASLNIEGTAEQAHVSLERSFQRSFRKRHTGFARLIAKKAETLSDNIQTAEDRLTVLELGTDYLFADEWKSPSGKANQTLVSAVFSHGFGGLFGAMDAKDDSDSSRTGSSGKKAGGQFNKVVAEVTRKQQLSADSWLWLRLNTQYSQNLLVSLEQMSLGGPNSVRAYPSAEYLRDSGYFASVEWATNLPFLYEHAVPEWLAGGRKLSWGRALALSLFVDHAAGWRNEPLSNEQRYVQLQGYGVGLTLQTQKAYINATLASPHDSEAPSNGHDPQFFISAEFQVF
ncbi:MAG: FimV/HubP family polar landmark protein [Sedimenticola sp.]